MKNKLSSLLGIIAVCICILFAFSKVMASGGVEVKPFSFFGTYVAPSNSTMDLAIGGTTSANSDLFVDVDADSTYINGTLYGGTIVISSYVEGPLLVNPTTATDISFDGDTNTGINWVEADQFSLLTGSTTALTVDGGIVGIATTTPSSSYKLDIYGDLRVGTAGSGIDSTFLTDVASGYVGIGTSTPNWHLSLGTDKTAYFGGNVYTGAMEFGADAGLVTAFDMPVSATPADGTVEGYSFAVDGTDILTVYSEADSAGAVDNTSVGIGTTTPTSKLQIKQSSQDNSGGIRITKSNATNTWAQYIGTDNYFHIAGGIEAILSDYVVFTTTGNVGIGTSSPLTSLSVEGIAGTALMNIASSTGESDFYIDEYGNVGVGTDAPSSALHVTNGNVRVSAGDLMISDDGNDPRIVIGDAFTVGNWGSIQWDSSSDILQLGTQADVDILVINENGNVGIGTSSPLTTLSVEGTAGTALMNIASSTGTSVLYVDEYDNVGIGTMSPTTEFEVNGTATADKINLGGGLTAFTLNGVSLDGIIGATSQIATELQYIALQHSNTAAAGSRFMFSRSRGTLASPLVVQDGDSLAAIDFAGYDGTDYVLAGQIDVEVDGTVAGNRVDGSLLFKTSNNSVLPTERMRITSGGNIGIGTSSPQTLLDVYSTATTTVEIDTSSVTQGGCLKIRDIDGAGYSYGTTLNGVVTWSTVSCE